MTNTVKSLTVQLLREKNLLGRILEDPAQYVKIPTCTVDHFTDATHKAIFKAFKEVSTQRSPDLPSIFETLREQEQTDIFSAVMSITSNSYLTLNIEDTYNDLNEAFKRRKTQDLIKDLQNDINNSKDLQTALTEFHYKTQSLKSDGERFAPTEIFLNSEFEEAAELCHFDGELVLRKGNIMLLQAAEGTGKSRTITAIIASNYAPNDSDNLGFKLTNSEQEIILHIDTEQEKTEVLHSMKRIIRRAGNSDMIENNKIKNYILQSFVTIPSISEKRNWLYNLIEKHNKKIGVLVLDGITDFITDINNLTESQDFITRLVSYMNVYDFGIIGTIHTNTGSDGSGKARGHIGSELKRKAGSNIAIVKTKLTHEFNESDGEVLVKRLVCLKNRFSSDDMSNHYAWNHERRMFTSCDLSNLEPGHKKRIAHASKVEQIMIEVLKDKSQVSHAELCELITDFTEKSKRTAIRYIETALQDGHVKKGENELYYLI